MYQGLNKQQIEAVTTVDGPLLVLAGAGSGKTRVVTFRISYLLQQGVPAEKILGLTFTNKAAGEMKERVEALSRSRVLICTFHSLGARILRESIHHLGYQPSFTIYDEDDVSRLLKSCLQEIGPEEKVDLKTVRTLISRAKNDFKGPDAVGNVQSTKREEQLLAPLYRSYLTKLKEYNALDFDDLLFLTVRLFREHPHVLERYQARWEYLLIDEYQDTNPTQYALVQDLVAKTHNLCVVGDPDQSIYSWRGADLRNILEFERDFPNAKIVRLEHNYRSRSNILEAANQLIRCNQGRLEKNLWSELGAGEPIKLFTGDTEQDEARFVASTIRQYQKRYNIPLSEIAIFYRTNAQSRPFEDYFLANRLPYIIVGGISFYQRREIKDILAFLRIVQSKSDFISFVRTVNLPKRGIGLSTVEKIQENSTACERAILDYCCALIENQPVSHPLKLTPKQKSGLTQYLGLIQELRRIKESCSLKELVTACIEQTHYLDYLKEEMETYQERKENLDELIAKAVEWELATENPTLEAFLEELSLKTTLDETADEDERVNLMTIHNGKGLEFTAVFLVGLEEDLFPHANSRDNESALEEERRLCYVGMTRAKEFLFLTHVRFRYLWGSARTQRPSRFLQEIPKESIEKERHRSLTY